MKITCLEGFCHRGDARLPPVGAKMNQVNLCQALRRSKVARKKTEADIKKHPHVILNEN
jgi:hypothetical protein